MFDAKQKELNLSRRNILIGRRGENLAARYIKKKGYAVIKRNHREGHDEIDIIGKSKRGEVVFFEVKTMASERRSESKNDFQPEDNFTQEKLNKIKRCSEMFVAKHQKIIKRQEWRIDLIAITIFFIKNEFIIKHYKNMI